MTYRSIDYLKKLIKELIKLPSETEWLEFKNSKDDPEMIGSNISALSNSAPLYKKSSAYLIWGVDDKTHEIIGTSFNYKKAKKGNEELESWLSRMILPRTDFQFYEIEIDQKKVVILEIQAANSRPILFRNIEYIRIGSNTKKLLDYPNKEKQLWYYFNRTQSELLIAKENVSKDTLFELLNVHEYYKCLDGVFYNKDKTLDDLTKENFIIRNEIGNYDITNLGALLLAKNIQDFNYLKRKAVRVILYKDKDRLTSIREQVFTEGYLTSFSKINDYILTVIPQYEDFSETIRKEMLGYPEIAIRELVANLIVHQDISESGTNPMVEIFSDRIEFSNAGAPLVKIERIIDSVPVARNNNLTGFFHKCGICEERGSGFDKIVLSLNKSHMLAPRIENQYDKFTKVTLYLKVPFNLISKEDKIRTCYMFACVSCMNGNNSINNKKVRELFDLDNKSTYMVSRIIKDTLEEKLIKPKKNDVARRYREYIPHWADESN